MPITVKCHSKHRNLLGYSFEMHPIILYNIGSCCHLSYILLFILVVLAFSKKKDCIFTFPEKSPKKNNKLAAPINQ